MSKGTVARPGSKGHSKSGITEIPIPALIQAGLQSGHLNRTFRRFQKDHGFALNIVIGYHILADDRLMCVGDADPFG